MNMKKIISSTLMASMLLGSSVCSVMALEENSVDKGESKIVAEVFDYGESVTSVVVDLGSVISADELKEDAFEVFAKNEEPEACIGISTGKTYYEGSRNITNMYVNSTSIPDGEADAEGQYVVIELKYGWKEYVDGVLTTVKQSNTCDYDIVMKDGAFSIFESLNVLLDMHYTITSNQNLGNLKQVDQILLTNDDVYRPIAGQFSAGKSNGLTYRLYEPTLGEGERPLIVWFHGSGEGGLSNITHILCNKGGVGFATEEAQEIFGGAYVLAPETPDNWTFAGKDYTEQAIALIQDVIDNNNIDPNRVVIAGCSAGGYMTWQTLLAAPDMFAAAVPICAPGIYTTEDFEAIKDVPIWMVHSKDDTTVDVEYSYANYYLLKELGADVTLTLYDHVIGYDEGSDLIHTYSGHWSWVYALNNDPTNDKGQSLFEWIAEQTLANDEDTVVNPDENEPVVKPDEKDPVEINPSNNVTQQPSGDQPTDVDNNQTVSVPNTGDHLNVVLPVTLLVLSAAIGYVVLRKRKEC